jgi:hypothetical protein
MTRKSLINIGVLTKVKERFEVNLTQLERKDIRLVHKFWTVFVLGKFEAL